MKNKIIKFLALSILFLCIIKTYAQETAINIYYTDFISNSKFEVTYLSKDMFKVIIERNKEDLDKNLISVMKRLTSLHVATSYKHQPDLQYNEVMKMMDTKTYSLLFTRQDEIDKISLFVKKEKDTIIEMVLIARDHVDFVILDITGDIDLEEITILGDALQFQGSEFLDQMNGLGPSHHKN